VSMRAVDTAVSVRGDHILVYSFYHGNQKGEYLGRKKAEMCPGGSVGDCYIRHLVASPEVYIERGEGIQLIFDQDARGGGVKGGKPIDGRWGRAADQKTWRKNGKSFSAAANEARLFELLLLTTSGGGRPQQDFIGMKKEGRRWRSGLRRRVDRTQACVPTGVFKVWTSQGWTSRE